MEIYRGEKKIHDGWCNCKSEEQVSRSTDRIPDGHYHHTLNVLAYRLAVFDRNDSRAFGFSVCFMFHSEMISWDDINFLFVFVTLRY